MILKHETSIELCNISENCREKFDKLKAKLEAELEDATQRLEQEKKKREAAEKNAKTFKEQATRPTQQASKADSEELRQIQVLPLN